MSSWTAGELALLRELYPKTPIDALTRRMGRSNHSIRHAAKNLGLKTDRMWAEADDGRLREAWGKVKTSVLARELGRSPSALKQHAARLGLDAERCYMPEEIALLRELYPTHTAAQIAERIHGDARAALAIYRLARKLGLRKQPQHADQVLDDVRRLNADGLPDAEIGRRLHLGHDQVKHIRRRLGLAHVPDIEGKRRAVKTQFARLGIQSGGELRKLAYANYARENGWPEDLRPREVQILNALATRGVPMAKKEICLAIGMPTSEKFRSGARRILLAGNGPGGTYTASLTARGLLTRLKRASGVFGRGKGRSVDLYCLAPLALEILQRRAEQCQAAK